MHSVTDRQTDDIMLAIADSVLRRLRRCSPKYVDARCTIRHGDVKMKTFFCNETLSFTILIIMDDGWRTKSRRMMQLVFQRRRTLWRCQDFDARTATRWDLGATVVDGKLAV